MKFKIYEANYQSLNERIGKLSKRSQKLGGAPITLQVTGTSDQDIPERPGFKVRMLEVELTGETPRFAGWSFLATIAHTPDGNVIRAVSGFEVDPKFRSNAPVCDHCKTARNRRDTYVVRHEDGRVLQVGSDCMKDFLGHTNPAALLTICELLLHAFDLCRGSHGPTREIERVSLPLYLEWVAEVVIKEGRYVTRKVATETGKCSTASTAYEAMLGRHGDRYTPTDAAKRLSEEARRFVVARFAPALAEDCDEAALLASLHANLTGINDHIKDFEHNLLTCARSESIEPRLNGVAAYIIEYYMRETGGRRREQAQLDGGFLRIFTMFKTATDKKLARPAIRLRDDQGHQICLKPAGAQSTNAGFVYVSSGSRFGSDYYGKISPDGKFSPVRTCPDSVREHLLAFSAKPEEVAGAYGKMTGQCCFCARALTDDRSTEVGYGPICADKYGLDWGTRNVPASRAQEAQPVAA